MTRFLKKYEAMIDKYILADNAGIIGEGVKQIVDFTDAVISAESLPAVIEKKESTVFESALNTPFNSLQELNAKKVMAAALFIAKRKGVLPSSIPTDVDAIDIASLADDAVSRMKVAYQTSIGNIDVYEGADTLIDQATARALAISDKVVARGVDLAIDKVGSVIARAYPPALPIVAVIKNYQPFITEKAQSLVKTGIQKLNTYAKTAVRKVGEYIKNKVASKVRTLLFS